MYLGHSHLFPQYFFRKRWFGSRENKERKDKVGNTFLPPAVRTLLFLNRFGEKDRSGGGKIRKQRQRRNTFLLPAVRTLLSLNIF
jgi:hypothetical protein